MHNQFFSWAVFFSTDKEKSKVWRSHGSHTLKVTNPSSLSSKTDMKALNYNKVVLSHKQKGFNLRTELLLSLFFASRVCWHLANEKEVLLSSSTRISRIIDSHFSLGSRENRCAAARVKLKRGPLSSIVRGGPLLRRPVFFFLLSLLRGFRPLRALLSASLLVCC